MAEEEQKKECPKKECPEKDSCPDFKGFHGFGPRCHGRMGFPPMWGMPPCHPHKHKERKCECGEVIPKRKPGEPKIRECPKCKKALPKKPHGFGMNCHKRIKFMKMMQMMGGPGCWGMGMGMMRPPFPCPPRGLEVHHYIHFGPPPPPPMFRPPFFGPPPMGRPPFFGKGPCEKGPCEEMGEEPCGRPPFPWGMGMGRHHMGPPGPFGFGPHFGFGPWGKPPCEGFGPCGKPPCCGKKCDEKKCEKKDEEKVEDKK